MLFLTAICLHAASRTDPKPFNLIGGMTVVFPGTPKATDIGPTPGISGVKAFLLSTDHGVCEVLYGRADNSAKPNDLIAGYIEGSVLDGDVALTEVHGDPLRGWPAADFKMTTGKGTKLDFSSRVAVVRDDVVAVLAGCEHGTPLPEEEQSFLKSVRIPDSIGDGPLLNEPPMYQRYSVGDSGLSGVFPQQPKLDQSAKDVIVYYSVDAVQTFLLSYGPDFLTPAGDNARAIAVEDSAAGGFAQQVGLSQLKKTKAIFLGKPALWAEGIGRDGNRWRVLCFLHGTQGYMAIAGAPEKLVHSEQADRFFASLSFAHR